ncbi:MAG: hypothetical protein WCW78_04025 [Candidatus Paceibacterota bacterium]|jgi:hypothetical protein
MKKALLILISIFLWLQIGHLNLYWVLYADWYPTSTAAKVLTPFSLNCNNSPFSEGTPEVSKHLQEQYKTFEMYLENQKEDFATFWLLVIMMPIFQLIIWIGSLCTWIFQIAIWLYIGISWLTGGGFLRYLGLMG